MKNNWQGEKIKLRALELSDEDFFFEWNQDSELSRMVDHVWFPSGRENIKEWLRKEAVRNGDNDELVFMIEDLEGQPVGIISTFRCDRRVGSFAYGVAIHSDHFRKGYGSEAVRLILHHFFNELRYQKCTVHVYSNNQPSLTLHRRIGFAEEGRLRRMAFTDGQYFDWIYFGILAEEFEARQN